MTPSISLSVCLFVLLLPPSTKDLSERESLSRLLAKKARWDAAHRTLTITGAGNVARDDLRLLRNMPSVTSLRIAYTLQDSDLVCLRDMFHVDTLVLAGGHFTDQAIVHVAAMPSLKTLTLESCRLAIEGIHALSRMDQLDSVSLVQMSLPDRAIADLASVPNLHVLTLRRPPSVRGLAACDQLRQLRLEDVDAARLGTDELVEELGELKRLESLSITVTEKEMLPVSAQKWFAMDFQIGSLTATRHYPLFHRLKSALPDSDVSVEFANQTVTFLSGRRRTTLRLR